MKRLTSALVIVGVLFIAESISVAAAAQNSADSSDVIVYVTRTGGKYHTAGCRYLRTSAIPMKLSEANQRYSPCSVCNLPVMTYEADKRQSTPPETKSSVYKQQTSGKAQCAAITRKGTRCKRMAQPGSAYCWQHSR